MFDIDHLAESFAQSLSWLVSGALGGGIVLLVQSNVQVDSLAFWFLFFIFAGSGTLFASMLKDIRPGNYVSSSEIQELKNEVEQLGEQISAIEGQDSSRRESGQSNIGGEGENSENSSEGTD
jgi:hypothetical protein